MHDGFKNEIKEQLTTHQDIHQDKILEFCKEPKTTKEIMAYLGLKDRRNFYLKYMRPLLDSGKLQMTIPDKPNTKNQKYQIKEEFLNRFKNETGYEFNIISQEKENELTVFGTTRFVKDKVCVFIGGGGSC